MMKKITVLAGIFIFIFSILFLNLWAEASSSPLLNVPLNSWVYSNLQKLEMMKLFEGEDSIAIHSKPLTRREVAALINRALVNIQKGKRILNEAQIIHLEKLVTEFAVELKEFGIRIITQDVSHKGILKQYQSDRIYQYIHYFIEKGYIDHSSTINFPTPRQHLAQIVSQMIFSLQSGQLYQKYLSETDIEYLDYLVTELKDELAFYGIQIIYLDKSKVLVNHLQDTFSVSGYLNQSIHLSGQNGWFQGQMHANKGMEFSQGLLILQFGALISGELWEEVPFLIDFSVDTQVYDIDNINLAPFSLNLNKMVLKFKTDSFSLSFPDYIPIMSIFDEFEIPEIVWQIGRDEMYWGPGYSGSLILSNNTASLDMIKYSGSFDLDQLTGNFGQVHFTKFFSQLDENRLLFGQRFEYSPDTPWRIGLSETAIADQDCGIAYFNPIPFPLSNYLTQQIYSNFPNLSEKENNINYNIGLDLQYQFDDGMKVYGEIMFDDFIFYQKENPFPGRHGLTIGSHIPNIFKHHKTDLLLEYTRINNYVYYPRKEWQYYLYQGESLGHPLGPDADQMTIEINYQLNDDMMLRFAYIHERHGEGQKGVPLPADPDIANENQFLSGIVEKSNNFLASLRYDLSEDWQVSLTGSLKNSYNQDNQLYQNNQELTFTAEIKFEF